MNALNTDSWYQFSRNDHTLRESLKEDIECDVCVVGAGLSGLSSAYHLAKQGFKTVVLEQNQVGWGASGRNGGQFIFGYSCDMSAVRKIAGKENARRLFQLSLDSLDFTTGFIEEHGIDCDLRMGHYHAALKPRHVKELEQLRNDLKLHYGFDDLSFLDAREIRKAIDSPKYLAGLFHGGSGHLHPLNYTLGFAKACEKAGVSIYENTAVQKIPKGSEKTLLTSGGKVRYRFLVLSGNAYLKNLCPKAENRVMPVGTYIGGTEVLGKETALGLIKNNAAVADMKFVLDYYRLSSDWRLLFGGRVSYSTLNPISVKFSMHRRIKDVFPQLKDVKMEFGWGGFVAITINRFPSFGRLENDVYYLQGYSGHGVALAGFAGKLLAESIAKTSSDFDLFAGIRHMPFPGGAFFRTPALVLGMLYHQLKDKL